MSVEARVVTTDPDLNVRLALAGLGITILFEHSVRDWIDAGELVPVLEEHCVPFPGFHLYFPRRRQPSAALRALIEHVREEVRA